MCLTPWQVLVDLSVSAPLPPHRPIDLIIWWGLEVEGWSSDLTLQTIWEGRQQQPDDQLCPHCRSTLYKTDLVWAQTCVLCSATWFWARVENGIQAWLHTKGSSPGSQWWASDLPSQWVLCGPRGSEGKTINIGLTGMKQDGWSRGDTGTLEGEDVAWVKGPCPQCATGQGQLGNLQGRKVSGA